jgi:hypothetical protein
MYQCAFIKTELQCEQQQQQQQQQQWESLYIQAFKLLHMENKTSWEWYTYLLTEPLMISYHLCSHSRTSHHFVEPKGSLPCSQ